MKIRLLAALVAVALASPAYAGDYPHHEHAFTHELLASNDAGDAWRRWAEDFSNEMRMSAGTMFGGRVDSSRVVKNAPYSAEIVTEANQPLPDGNVISKKTSAQVHRDAQGRTRQETGSDAKTRSIFINDPVDGKRIVLVPDSKRAVVTPRTFHTSSSTKDKQVISLNGTQIRVEDGKAFVDGKEITGGKTEFTVGNKVVRINGVNITVDGKEVFSLPNVVIKTLGESETGDGTMRKEVRVQIVTNGDGSVLEIPMPPMPPLAGTSLMRFEGMGKLGKGVTTSLGTKTFDGVSAEGKKSTWTIAAGSIGNKNPIEVTSESWYSPDLQVTVYSRYNDPRQGESIYRLAGIKRGEPASDLFRVPVGYETMSKEAEREKARKERSKQLEMQRLDREQQRLDQERERLQRERERLKG